MFGVQGLKASKAQCIPRSAGTVAPRGDRQAQNLSKGYANHIIEEPRLVPGWSSLYANTGSHFLFGESQGRSWHPTVQIHRLCFGCA